jgi:hypothetical protein
MHFGYYINATRISILITEANYHNLHKPIEHFTET